jgi:hypothetical protein
MARHSVRHHKDIVAIYTADGAPSERSLARLRKLGGAAHEPLRDILLGIYTPPRAARQGRMSTVAAAVALAACGVVEAVPDMLRMLKRIDAIGGLNFALIRAMQDMGEGALEPTLRAFDMADGSLERQQFGLILAGLGVDDARVSAAVVRVIEDNASVGATIARRYEVPGLARALGEALDAFEVRLDSTRFHNQAALDLAEAIASQGAELSAGQRLKVAAARDAMDHGFEPEP